VLLGPKSFRVGLPLLVALLTIACGHDAARSSPAPTAGASSQAPPAVSPADMAPPASQTGGFDGEQAYDYVVKLVSFGPRPPASNNIRHTQAYIGAQLKSFGCAVDIDDFHASTPIGELAMKNIVAKIPGEGQGIILLLTHYDTARIENFVGAEDGGSSTGLMMEMARLLCAGKKQPNAVWIAFLDGEEAQVSWSDTDSVYGSRELAARLALSGDLKRVRAVILADMIGQKNLVISRESNSTKWLTDLVWDTADKLGYKDIFDNKHTAIEDDHGPFLSRGVPAVDIIDLWGYQEPGYWHSPQDTLDKLSPRNIAIVGQVILASVSKLQQKFR
jgi:Peptidase family M28